MSALTLLSTSPFHPSGNFPSISFSWPPRSSFGPAPLPQICPVTPPSSGQFQPLRRNASPRRRFFALSLNCTGPRSASSCAVAPLGHALQTSSGSTASPSSRVSIPCLSWISLSETLCCPSCSLAENEELLSETEKRENCSAPGAYEASSSAFTGCNCAPVLPSERTFCSRAKNLPEYRSAEPSPDQFTTAPPASGSGTSGFCSRDE